MPLLVSCHALFWHRLSMRSQLRSLLDVLPIILTDLGVQCSVSTPTNPHRAGAFVRIRSPLWCILIRQSRDGMLMTPIQRSSQCVKAMFLLFFYVLVHAWLVTFVHSYILHCATLRRRERAPSNQKSRGSFDRANAVEQQRTLR